MRIPGSIPLVFIPVAMRIRDIHLSLAAGDKNYSEILVGEMLRSIYREEIDGSL